MEHTKLYINGMTCINCQTRIQNALKKQPGIKQATVSYETETADVSYDSSVISLEQIQGLLDELGYSASTQKASRAKTVCRILFELGIIVLLYFLLQHFGILNYLAPASLADAQMGYGMLFVIGLITSVHCIAMCGGINLSQTLQKGSASSANVSSVSRTMFQNALAYNVGRVISYTIIGGILGGIGALTGMAGTLQTSSFFQGLLKLLAGALMVVMGINMLGLFPKLRRFHLRIPLPLFQKGTQKEDSKGFSKKNPKRDSKRRNVSRKRKTPFLIGLFNGLMPCGPLQSMQIVALASANPFTGALSMFFFALGTMPLMLGFGSIVAGLGKRFTKQVLKCGAILVVVMGLSMMSQGTALSGMSSKINTLFSAKSKTAVVTSNPNSSTNLSSLNNPNDLSDSNDLNDSNDSNASDTNIEKDGIQYVSSTLESGHYPDITVKAGTPVKWTIHAEKSSINGCNYKILLPDFDTECVFEEGDNTIEFTPQKTGVYTYSCWMGMITGKIYVESE